MSKLFVGITKDETNANLSWIVDKTPLYNSAYKLAAQELCRGFADRPVNEKDTLIIPIIFLYRHYIEIELKTIIQRLDNLLDNNQKKKKSPNHKLLPLWNTANSLYKTLIANNNIQVFTPNNAKKETDIITELHNFDSRSTTFRYARDLQNNDSLEKIDYISVANFQNQIEIVVRYLEQMTETICHAKELYLTK